MQDLHIERLEPGAFMAWPGWSGWKPNGPCAGPHRFKPEDALALPQLFPLGFLGPAVPIHPLSTKAH